MINTSELKHYGRFKNTGLIILHRYLTELLNCEVYIEEKPLNDLSDYFKIDFEENPNRYVYIIDEDRVVISTKVFQDRQVISILPIKMSAAGKYSRR